MTYASLMVRLAVGRSNTGVLRCATDLAERLDARVFGVAVCQPSPLVYGDGYVDGTMIEQERVELERELKVAQAEFDHALQGRNLRAQWQGKLAFQPLAEHLVALSRGADLIITAAAEDRQDSARHLDVGDLVMQAGRPVLLVPADAGVVSLSRALVAWKDGRESRRAIADALPLLRRATHVLVAEMAAEGDLPDARARVADVAAWLGLHGVTAQPQAMLLGKSVSHALEDLANDHGSDLLVAGAYGHSRLREWALGGVTRDLLLPAHRCALLSH